MKKKIYTFFSSGPVLAFAQTIHMTASFISPIVAGLLTQESVSAFSFNFIINYTFLYVKNENSELYKF